LPRLTAQRAPNANQDIQMMKHRDPLREQRYLRLARACFLTL